MELGSIFFITSSSVTFFFNFKKRVIRLIIIKIINKIGLNLIDSHGKFLTEYAFKKISKIKGVTIYGYTEDRGPVISFNIKGVHPHDLAQLLDQQNICIRVGHHCAQPLTKKFGTITG